MKVSHALLHIGLTKLSSESTVTAQCNLTVTTFSDSIVISSDPERFSEIIYAAGWLQAHLLGLGILMRGGLTIGNLSHEDNMIYGQGLIDAYDIESKVAITPRIVIDPDLLSSVLLDKLEYFLEQDSDGLHYINYFAFDGAVEGIASLAEDAYDPYWVWFEQVDTQITKNLEEKIGIGQRAKWLWVQRQCNIHRKEYEALGVSRLTRQIRKFNPDY